MELLHALGVRSRSSTGAVLALLGVGIAVAAEEAPFAVGAHVQQVGCRLSSGLLCGKVVLEFKRFESLLLLEQTERRRLV